MSRSLYYNAVGVIFLCYIFIYCRMSLDPGTYRLQTNMERLERQTEKRWMTFHCFICVCVCACVHLGNACVCVCAACFYTNTHTHTHTHTYTNTYIHTHTRARAFIHTQSKTVVAEFRLHSEHH